MSQDNKQNIMIISMQKDIEYIKVGQDKLEGKFDSFQEEVKKALKDVKHSTLKYADNSITSHVRDCSIIQQEKLDNKYASKGFEKNVIRLAWVVVLGVLATIGNLLREIFI